MPNFYEWGRKLEAHYGNMQDIEFTIQKGTLYILQTRSGKRTGHAAIKIATDMVHESLIDKKKAVKTHVEPAHLDQLLHPQIDATSVNPKSVLGTGLPASPGAAVGKVVFFSDDAEEAGLKGDPSFWSGLKPAPKMWAECRPPRVS
jgi:pyruvate, orthophosphate dikinase